MRVYALYIFTLVLMAWTMRDWFVGACGLLLTNLLLEHPDYPKEVFGISGANPWNVLFLCTLVAWLMQRSLEPPAPPMLRRAKVLVGLFIAALTITCASAALNMTAPPSTGLTTTVLVLDFYLNPLKILFLAFLVYEGARTPQRKLVAMTCIVASVMVTALLVLKYRMVSGLSADFMKGRQRLGKEVGLHANQLGWVLAGTFWGLLAMAGLWQRRLMRAATYAASAIPGLAALVVQSRAAYLALAATGLIFGLVRWRKLLVLLPGGAIAVMVAFPSVTDRLLMGVDLASTPFAQTEMDMETISAGRTDTIWPPVLDVIRASPVLGEGRVSILRTAARRKIEDAIGYCPSHPHNAYLELLADGGILGTTMVMSFYVGFFILALKLFRMRWSPLATAVGGMALALLAARLATGVSGNSLFPIRSMFGLFAMGGLALRLAADHAHRAWPRPSTVGVPVPHSAVIVQPAVAP